MTRPIDEDICRAAEILKREAANMKFDNTCMGKWYTDCKQVKRDHAEMLRIARRLIRYVGTL